MIFINFKTYDQGTGANALALVKVLEEVADFSHMKIIPVVQAADLKEVVENTRLEVWVQKIDPFDFGAHTGAVLPEAVLEDGAGGTFLNHSEAKIDNFSTLEKSVKRSLEVGLKTLVFARNLKELKDILVLKPTFIAYEPPELIASKEASVTSKQPKIIADAVEMSKGKGIPLIVGAGIKTAQDVQKSIQLGAVGVAVASDVVLAKDPKKELMDLVVGFN